MPGASEGIEALVRPTSVAVVGARGDEKSFGGRFYSNLAMCEGVERHAVSRSPLEGEPTARSLLELAAVPDLVVLATPPSGVVALLEEAASLGVGAVVVLTRVPPEERPRAAAIAAEAGMALLGGSSLGLVNANDSVVVSSSVSLALGIRPGPLGLVAQSGAMMGLLHARAMTDGLGLGFAISTGEQIGLAAEDLLVALAGEESISVVGAYVEQLDPDRFAEAAEALGKAGKHLVVLKGGLTSSGAAAAATHSGALCSSGRAFEELCRSVGAVLAEDPSDLLAVMQAFTVPGSRFNVASLSGGLAVVAGDLATRYRVGLEIPHGPAAALCREGEMAVNPFDVDGLYPEIDKKARAISALASPSSGEGAVLVLSDMPGLEELVSLIDPASEELSLLTVCSECTEQYEHVVRSHVQLGGSVFRGMRSLFSALARTRPLEVALASSIEPEDPERTYRQLSSAGLPVLSLQRLRGDDELEGALDRLGLPLVLKLASPQHRGRDGVVVAESLSQAREAFAVLARRGEVLAQQFSEPGVELYVGYLRDELFGALVFLGRGGAGLEAEADVAVGRCPADRQEIAELFATTAIGRFLADGPASRLVDLEAFYDVAFGLVSWALSEGPSLFSLDVNPLVVHGRGASVVDAKVRRSPLQQGEAAA